MIRRIFSSYAGFKNLDLHSGLNLLIVDKEKESTEKQTRNSAGKSSLVEIIHFIFGADNDENAFYNKDVFINELFSAEVEYSNHVFEISRCGVKRNRIFFNKKIDNFLNISLDYDEQFNLYSSSVSDWKKAIGEYLFSIPTGLKEVKYNPSFRAIFSYFARRETAGGMIEPKKNARQQQAYDEQVNLSFLLGLDWTLSSKFQELRDREKILRELKKSLKQGVFDSLVGSPATLRSEIIVLESKVAEMQVNLGRFSLLPEYRQFEDELTRINIEIKENIDRNTIDNELLISLKSGASESSNIDYSSIEQLYAESIKVFPDMVKKRFEEVKEFHNSVIRNRTLYLASEIERVKNNIRVRTNNISQLTQRQTYVMNLLRSHGALDQYNKLNADLVKKQA